jgi:hypothetical protein
MGYLAAYNTQQDNAIAIGYNAGYTNQGSNSIAIGQNAGQTNQPGNSIILNATGIGITGISNGLCIGPVRGITSGITTVGGATANYVLYNNTTNELYYNNAFTNIGLLGNVARVDSVYGNDITSSVNGLPYKTVNAAITAITAFGTPATIWIMPGTYTLLSGITIPTGCAIRGMSLQTTTIQMTGVSISTILVTMSSQTRIEDLTLTLTTATSGITITGIQFPSTTTTSSKVRACVVNVSSSATSGTGNIYGIYADSTATTSNPFTIQSLNAIQRTTVNTSTGTGSTANVYSIYIDPSSSCQMAIRDAVFFAGATGATTNAIGAYNGSTASFLSLKTSSCYGGLYDIQQTSTIGNTAQSIIQLSSTDLLNSNADAYGFSVINSPNLITFTLIGGFTNGTNSYYLTPGTLLSLPTANIVYSTQFNQKTIVYSITAFYSVAIAGAATLTVTLLSSSSYSTAGTQFGPTITFNNTNTTGPGARIAYQNFSASIISGNYLQVRVSTTSNVATGNDHLLSIVLSTY